MPTAVGLFLQLTGFKARNEMSRRFFNEVGHCFGAMLVGDGATRSERAARGRVQRARDIAFQNNSLRVFGNVGVGHRNCRHQSHRVSKRNKNQHHQQQTSKHHAKHK